MAVLIDTYAEDKVHGVNQFLLEGTATPDETSSSGGWKLRLQNFSSNIAQTLQFASKPLAVNGLVQFLSPDYAV